jgi:hypothetical protein
MNQFKIRNKIYEIKEKDYFEDNGGRFIFFRSGDYRVLRTEKRGNYIFEKDYICLPKKISDKINFTLLPKSIIYVYGVKVIKYYVTKEFLEDENNIYRNT